MARPRLHLLFALSWSRMRENRAFPTIESLSCAAVLATLVVASCGTAEHAPFAPTETGHRPTKPAASDSGIFHIPPPTLPPADAPGICGRTVVPIVVDRPNLYFIVDASGSMAELMDEAPINGLI